MRITILTLFPEMFAGPFSLSILDRARKKGRVAIDFVNIRDDASDAYGSVDDHPYGGGNGMILRVDVVDRALERATRSDQGRKEKRKIILLDPKGTPYTQEIAQRLTVYNHLILICGHYEGADERIRKLVDMEVSIGDYILTGGEIAAMAVTDSVVRLLPGVLSKKEALRSESFTNGLLEYPQYTRPRVYRKWKVPAVLTSGNHARIAAWRRTKAESETKKRRPDL